MTDTDFDADRSKFILALIVIAAASGLLALGRIDGAQWVSATTWTVAAYMLGQVGAVVAQGYATQTAAKAFAITKGAAAAVLIVLLAAPVARAQSFPNGLFSDGFELAVQCGQQQTANVYFQINNHGIVDATRFENLLGKASFAAPAVAFPGIGTSPVIDALRKDGFIAARFVAPELDPGSSGAIKMGENYASSRTITLSISPHCGFDVEPEPDCIVREAWIGQGITWMPAGGTYVGVACPIIAGRTYFLNIKFDPQPPPMVTYGCLAATCKLPLTNSVGN